MAVRAKFRLNSITHYEWDSKKLQFAAQLDHTIPENEKFTKNTPCGNLEITIDNPAAVEQFVIGKCYYLDFTPAD